MGLSVTEINALCHNKFKEVIQAFEPRGIDVEYFDMFEDGCLLDGWFTSEQLRLIADKMDEVKKEIEKSNE